MISKKLNQILKIEIFLALAVFSFLILFPKIGQACMCAEVSEPDCPGGKFCAFGNAAGWTCAILKDGECGASCLPGAGGCFSNPDGSHCSACAGINAPNCNDNDFNCLTSGCPAELGYEGNVCLIDADEGGSCANPLRGKWDPDERMCLNCSGPLQSKKLADSSQICYHLTGAGLGEWAEDPCAIVISQTCETACPGADPQCDEKAPGSPCGIGGTCDANCQCVVFTPQCNDGVDNDLDGKTDFPADPQCTDASDNDEADGVPVDCESDCTCTCPDECPCGSGTCPPELRGGLVPCGKNCDDPCTKSCECCPCTLCHLFVLFKRIVDFVTINIIFPLAVLMFVIGGVMFLTAGGDPGKIGGAKKILTAVVIGLAIILAAWLIVGTVITFLTPASSPLQNWSTIDCPVP